MKIQFFRVKKTLILLILISLLFSTFSPIIKAETPPDQVWVRIVDNSNNDQAYCINTNSLDQILVSGYSRLNGIENIYTVIYNQDGTIDREIITNTPFSCRAFDIALDSQDNILLAGYCDSQGYTNFYVVKQDLNGDIIWDNFYDSGNADKAYGIDIDSQHNVIVAGIADNNYYTIKYDLDGNEIWNKTFDSGYDDCIKKVTVDSQDNIIVTGFSEGIGCRNWYTIKYDSEGNELWNHSYGNGNINTATSVSCDSNDNIVLTGIVYNGGNANIHVIKLNTFGVELWNLTYDKTVDDAAYDVKVNIFDEIVIGGTYYQTFQGKNFILLEFEENGDLIWEKTYDKSGKDDYLCSVTIDKYNRIFAAGFTENNNDDYDFITIKYGTKPRANFEYAPLNPKVYTAVSFSDTSIDPAGKITSWHWAFGNGNTSSEQNPIYSYDMIGTYNVTLTVLDDDGNIDMISKEVTVSNNPPVADFTFNIVNLSNNLVIFTSNSFDVDGAIVNYTWDFDSEHVLYDQNTNYHFNENKIYNVTLTVRDDMGDSASITKPVDLTYVLTKVTGVIVEDAYDGKINASWNSNDPVENIIFYKVYRNNSSIFETSLTNYTDTGLEINQSYLYQISAVNNYYIEGELSDPVFGISTNSIVYNNDTNNNETNNNESSNNESNNNESNNNESGNNGSGNESGTGEEENSEEENEENNTNPPSPPRPPSGGGGSNNNIVYYNPIANLSVGEPYTGFIGENITFNGSASYDSDGYIKLWSWDFGNQKTGEGEIINHSYLEPGTYNVTLTVTDNHGLKSSDETEVIILQANSPPEIPTILCPINATIFTPINISIISNDADLDQIKYYVEWGDGNQTETKFYTENISINLTYIYESTGDYQISIYSFDNKTFSDIVYHTITILFAQVQSTQTESKDGKNNSNNTGFICLIFLLLLILFIFLFFRPIKNISKTYYVKVKKSMKHKKNKKEIEKQQAEIFTTYDYRGLKNKIDEIEAFVDNLPTYSQADLVKLDDSKSVEQSSVKKHKQNIDYSEL